jgi:hypothetical protein
MAHRCPVCGYPNLAEPPRSRSGGASYEICPSCGFQFGVSDDDAGLSYDKWREYWREGGMRWASKGRPAPANWDPEFHLRSMSRKGAGTRAATPSRRRQTTPRKKPPAA